MKMITEGLYNDADLILKEIEADIDVHDYYWPVSQVHSIFEQAYMKFLNRNLNHFNFENMITHALVDGNTFNPAFPNTIDFCDRVRNITGDTGPFGRMCIWNLPPGKRLLPHVDNFDYHRSIIRNIFIVSENINNTLEIRIRNINVEFDKGTLFQFFPGSQRHTFINNSDKTFYFLGFDFWNETILEEAASKLDLEAIAANPDRYKPYSKYNLDAKHLSNH